MSLQGSLGPDEKKPTKIDHCGMYVVCLRRQDNMTPPMRLSTSLTMYAVRASFSFRSMNLDVKQLLVHGFDWHSANTVMVRLPSDRYNDFANETAALLKS